MKKLFYSLFTWLQHLSLSMRGWRFGKNVMVSYKGVRKIGRGNIICSDNVNINSEVMLIALKDITIGKNSTLAYRVMVTTSANPNAPYNSLSSIYPPIYKEVHIGENCWIGAGVIILPGVVIGDGSVVAAGSVVTNNVPDNVMVAGVPAVVKKQLKTTE